MDCIPYTIPAELNNGPPLCPFKPGVLSSIPYVTVASDYAVYENNTNYHVLNQEQVNVICALHTLWLHGVGGEQADFSDCLLKGINLSSRNLNRAVFAGAKLVDCLMYDAKLNTSIFDGAKIQNCQLMPNVTLLLGNHELMMCRAVYKPATDAALDHFHHAYTSQPRHYMSSLADRLSYISVGTYQELVLDTSQGASSISLE